MFNLNLLLSEMEPTHSILHQGTTAHNSRRGLASEGGCIPVFLKGGQSRSFNNTKTRFPAEVGYSQSGKGEGKEAGVNGCLPSLDKFFQANFQANFLGSAKYLQKTWKIQGIFSGIIFNKSWKKAITSFVGIKTS